MISVIQPSFAQVSAQFRRLATRVRRPCGRLAANLFSRFHLTDAPIGRINQMPWFHLIDAPIGCIEQMVQRPVVGRVGVAAKKTCFFFFDF